MPNENPPQEFCVMWGNNNSFEIFRILDKHAVGLGCGFDEDKNKWDACLTCIGEGDTAYEYQSTYSVSGLAKILGVRRLVDITWPHYSVDKTLKTWPRKRQKKDRQERQEYAYAIMSAAYADVMTKYKWKKSYGHMWANITPDQKNDIEERGRAVYEQQVAAGISMRWDDPIGLMIMDALVKMDGKVVCVTEHVVANAL